MPPALTVAIELFELLHVPPPMPLSVVVAPAHTIGVPVMVPAFGRELTVTTVVVTALPQTLVVV
jgi:hypothetical protein